MIRMAARPGETSFGGEQMLPIPWREAKPPKRLRIGWYTEDGAIKVASLSDCGKEVDCNAG
jgi:hypothetical protein